MQVMHGRLRDSEAQKERYYEHLLAAETAADRLRSKTVMVIKPRSGTTAADSPREATEEHKTPSSPLVSGLVN
jgi:hypothetical protein